MNNNLQVPKYLYDGYDCVTIDNKPYFIHVLVAFSFIKNVQNKPYVFHVDGNRLNNNIKNLVFTEIFEEWMNIWHCGIMTDYFVSNYGRIRIGDKIMSQHINGTYYRITLFGSGHYIHKIVGSVFIPNPDGKLTINHKDHNRLNNHISNLEWMTQSEQNYHKRKPQELRGGRKIWRIDKNTGEKIEMYQSVTLAAEWIAHNNTLTCEGTTHKGTINNRIATTARANSNLNTAYGYRWFYDDSDNFLYADEEWRTIPPNYIDGLTNYMVSNYGRVKFSDGTISVVTKMKEKKNEYLHVTIGHREHSIHRIVAQTFLPNPENKHEVNHIDGVKYNNNVNNLEWVFGSENVIHAHKTGLIKTCKKVTQYDMNWIKIRDFDSIADAGRALGVASNGIGECCNNKRKSSHGFKWGFFDNPPPL